MLKEFEKAVKDILPEECGFSKIEAEGLTIVIYVDNIREFYNNDQLIKKLAYALKKKITIRCSPEHRQEPEYAKKFIEETIPEEAGVKSITFNPVFGQVMVEAMKPGLVIGKGGETLKRIITETGWIIVVQRIPTMDSSTITGVRKSLLKKAEERKKFLTTIGKKILSEQPSGSSWVKVTALGGAREVGRSCFSVETPNSRILLDCGINPEVYDKSKSFPLLNELGCSLSEIDAVIVSHAHLDHCGFIPYLFAYGYEGPVYCTPPTRDMAVMLQMDYLSLVNKIPNAVVPYGIKDIHEQLIHTIPVQYGDVVDITPEVKMTFYNAGHILGSSLVHLHINNGLHNLVYTGDMKFGFTQLFDPAHCVFPRIETLIMESTYGGKTDIMPNRKESETMIMDIVKKTIERNGKVLIPVFAVGRSQEIMLVFEHYMREAKIDNIPIYLDGMIREASAIHTAYPEYLKMKVRKKVLADHSPFESEIFETVKGDRDKIIEGKPSIILATAGMMSGGPVLEYLRHLAPDEKNSLIFIGYQSPLSLGHKIQRGLKEVPLVNDEGKSESVKINMEVHTVDGFSGHSDRRQLLAYLKNISPKPNRVILCHGDENKIGNLGPTISKLFKMKSDTPMVLDSMRLK
ncbi:beta-CASP ribonuclease aCPSF1 [Candidatus Micrarchaeota archaeon]|nr:beta-CASP ribonuclease aCPSF1 [Candidatus Micrarchaeota archaeon]